MTLLSQRTIEQVSAARFPINRAKLGTKHGNHRSISTGSSTEFAQHRQYCPRDEPSTIDWRVLARTDRLMVKQYDQETNLRATLLIDSSASMGFHDEKKNRNGSLNPNKLSHAKRLAAALAWILIRQGDAVGLISYARDIVCRSPHASTPTHLHRLLDSLEQLTPQSSSDSDSASVLHKIADSIPSRGLIILCSDLFLDPESLRNALFHFQHRNHEVVVIQIMTPDEVSFPFEESICFRDIECQQNRFETDPKAIRDEYQAQLKHHLQSIEQLCSHIRADYLFTTTDQEIAVVVNSFLDRRHGRASGRNHAAGDMV